MKKATQTKILEKAIAINGKSEQMNMIIEECSELIKAVCKYKRHQTKRTIKEMCGEIADVEIMLIQARMMMQQDELINKIKIEKIERLDKRLQKKVKNRLKFVAAIAAASPVLSLLSSKRIKSKTTNNKTK